MYRCNSTVPVEILEYLEKKLGIAPTAVLARYYTGHTFRDGVSEPLASYLQDHQPHARFRSDPAIYAVSDDMDYVFYYPKSLKERIWKLLPKGENDTDSTVPASVLNDWYVYTSPRNNTFSEQNVEEKHYGYFIGE